MLVQLQVLYVPGARKAGSKGRRRGGAGWRRTIKDLACLVTLHPCRQTKRSGQPDAEKPLRGKNTSMGKTETPLYKPPAGTLSSLEKPRHTSPVLMLRNWDFFFCLRTGLREHTMPSVETPCLEGRTVCTSGKG